MLNKNPSWYDKVVKRNYRLCHYIYHVKKVLPHERSNILNYLISLGDWRKLNWEKVTKVSISPTPKQYSIVRLLPKMS